MTRLCVMVNLSLSFYLVIVCDCVVFIKSFSSIFLRTICTSIHIFIYINLDINALTMFYSMFCFLNKKILTQVRDI